jgi:histone H3/H4
MNNITKASIYQLVKDISPILIPNLQISNLVYEELRIILEIYVDKLVRQITIIMDYMKSRTMSVSYVYFVLKNIPASNDTLKRCLREEPNENSCFYIPKASFKRFLHSIVEKYMFNIKYSEKALNLMHISCEEYLKKLMYQSVFNTRHANRVGLQPKDIQLARRFVSIIDKYDLINLNEQVDYKLYIKKIIPEDKKISKNVLKQINMIINRLGQVIMMKSIDLLLLKKRSTIDAKTIQSAVSLVMTGEILKHAISEAIRSLTKFLSINNASRSIRRNRIESKCGLYFSVSRTKKLMKSYIEEKRVVCRLSKNAVIFLTTVLEYITAELLDVLSLENEEITGKILKKVVENDEELSGLIYSLNIEII